MEELIASTLRLSTPLLFAAMGGILCERAGVATICLEGVMLLSAWTAAVVNYHTGNPWLAIQVGMFAGLCSMSLHAFLSITAKADHIISGVVVNSLAAGITPMLNNYLFNGPTNSPSIPLDQRLQTFHVPGLSELPFVGPAFFSHVPLIYLAILFPFVIHYLIFYTRFGLRVQASGDSPTTLRTTGVSPSALRYLSMAWGGILCSLGGTYLAIAHTSQFTRDMTAGRGFIALAAIIFGKWKPLPTMVACLFFGLTDAMQIRLQGTLFFGSKLPIQFIQALPYIVTLIVLVGFVGKMRAPLAIGQKLE